MQSTRSVVNGARPAVRPSPPTSVSLFESNLLLKELLQRWKGVTPILWGRQLEQEQLDGTLIYLSVMNASHLPDRQLSSPVTDFYHFDTTPNDNLEVQNDILTRSAGHRRRLERADGGAHWFPGRSVGQGDHQGAGVDALGHRVYRSVRLHATRPKRRSTGPLDYVTTRLAKEQPQPTRCWARSGCWPRWTAFYALANELGLSYRGAAQPGENLLLPTTDQHSGRPILHRRPSLAATWGGPSRWSSSVSRASAIFIRSLSRRTWPSRALRQGPRSCPSTC